MIDYFSLALTHGLLLLAVWRLLRRTDLDQESANGDPAPQPDSSGLRIKRPR